MYKYNFIEKVLLDGTKRERHREDSVFINARLVDCLLLQFIVR